MVPDVDDISFPASITQDVFYTVQYHLNVTETPEEGGNDSLLTGWYYSGSSITLSEHSAPGYLFANWTGTGSGSYSGNSTDPSITMNGPVNETAHFLPVYNITFREEGLPQYSAFAVRINGYSKMAFNGAITYELPAGSYSYTIGNVTGFRPSINSSVIKVTNSSITIIVNFTAVHYTVTFAESGLPLGKAWSIEFSNGTSYNSTGTEMQFSMVDGFYSYNVSSNNEAVNSPLIHLLDIYGSSVMVNVTFISDPYVQISLLPAGSNLTVNGIYEQTAQGQYRTFLPPGFYFINATEPGYVPYSNFIYLQAGNTYSYNVSLTKLSHYGYLEGDVSPGSATVIASSVSIPVVDGHYKVSLSPGTYYVSFSEQGYASAVREVNITSGITVYLNMTMERAQETSTLYGYVSPGNASIVVNGFVAYVNATGFYRISLPDGYYHISIYSPGYFPESVNISLLSSYFKDFNLTKEPDASSKSTSGQAEAQGFNVTLSNLKEGKGFLSVDYSSGNNGSIVISIPFSVLSNVTISEILNSTVFIGDQSYSNFTISISSNYSILLRVYGLATGDPILYWKYSPSAVVPSQTQGNNPFPFPYIIAFAAVAGIASIAAFSLRKVWRR